jgi:cation diffusion facilitator family transporter
VARAMALRYVRKFPRNQRNFCEILSKRVENNESAKGIIKLGGVANILLGIVKGTAGYASGSTGLIADSANSFGDVLTDIVVYYALVKSRSGTSPENPWGHGKIEPLGTLLVGGILLSTGVGIGYTSLTSAIDIGATLLGEPNSSFNTMPSFSDLVKPENLPMMAALLVAGGSAISKEIIFQKTLKIGQEVNSSVLIANAWHHRSDAFVSGAVLIGLFGTYSGHPIMDPLTGLLVSGIICKQGISLLLDSVKDLTDSSASEDEVSALRSICLSIPGILSVISLNARVSGPYLFVDCTVGVSGDITASTAHHLAEQVKSQLLNNSPDGRVADCIVHVDPIGTSGLGHILPEGFRNYQEITKIARETVLTVDGIVDVSHIHIYYRDDGSLALKIDVIMKDDLVIKDAYEIAKQARIAVENVIPGSHQHFIDIDMELQDR